MVRAELAERVGALLAAPPWRGFAPRDAAVLAAALGEKSERRRAGTDWLGKAESARPAGQPWGRQETLAGAEPQRPSEAVDLAAGRDPVELVLARALGAEWLDRYLAEWRHVGLEIGGADLLAAGVPEGPALGRGLDAALRAKLDGEIAGREEELATALAAARD